MRLYDRDKKGGCTKEEESITIIKEREERGVQVHQKTIKEKVYQTLEVTSSNICIFYRKERQ